MAAPIIHTILSAHPAAAVAAKRQLSPRAAQPSASGRTAAVASVNQRTTAASPRSSRPLDCCPIPGNFQQIELGIFSYIEVQGPFARFVVVRCGTSREGLPLGVQIVAKPWRDDIA